MGNREAGKQVDTKMARRLINQTGGSNLGNLRTLFDLLFPGEADGLDPETFSNTYCESCSPASRPTNQIPKTSPIEGDVIEYLLMLKVKPHAANSYLVKANLVTDYASSSEAMPDEHNFRDIKGLPLDNISIIQFDEILDHAIEECSANYGVDRNDLIVQWFLPTELLNLSVEQMRIREGRLFYIEAGKACRSVILRSYDRQKYYRKSLAAWKKRWQQFLTRPSCKVSQMLPEICSEQDLPASWRNNCDIWGSHFVLPTDAQMQDVFWDRYFTEGFPFALWRRDARNEIGKAELEQLVNQSVQDLPTAVAQVYQNRLPSAALAQSATTITDRSDLTNLVLLWDNPFRPFPDFDSIDYQSA
ncbi:MAG: hypothetical protein RLZZ511_3430 [Cyanobacteriota bacterium]